MTAAAVRLLAVEVAAALAPEAAGLVGTWGEAEAEVQLVALAERLLDREEHPSRDLHISCLSHQLP